MASSASRRAAMVGPSANFMPSSMRATSTPPMNSVFSPRASSVDQKLRLEPRDRGRWPGPAVVRELGGDGAQHGRRHAHVAIGHHHQVVARGGQHAVQAVDLGVGIGRLAGDDEARGNRRVARPQLFHHRYGGVVRRCAPRRGSRTGGNPARKTKRGSPPAPRPLRPAASGR